VSKNAFLQLREIDSLRRMKNQYNSDIQSEKERLAKLDQKRHENENAILEQKTKLVTLQNNLLEIDAKLTGSRLNDEYKDKYELQGLEILEEIPLIETEIKEKQIFLSGLAKSRDEIALEVQEIIKKKSSDIINCEERIKLLEQSLPNDFNEIYKKVSALKLSVGMFTKVDQMACHFCRYTINKVEESEIDIQFKLKTCPQCRRIFLPNQIL
jgi:predicted  nucleic acid-binding Zn-ribbon protein